MADKEIQKRLETNHPSYNAMLNSWTLFDEAYHGNGGFADGTNLIKFDKESDNKYGGRKNLATYFNYAQPIIDTYNGFIYKRVITRSTESEIINKFWNNVTGTGNTHIDTFFKRACITAQIYGHSLIVVDKPSVVAETVAEKEALGLSPYAYLLSPLAMTDWAVDATGELLWAVIQESYIPNVENPMADHQEMTRYRIWTREGWTLYKDDGEFISGAKHNLGVVPIVVVQNKNDTLDGIVGISDIVYIAGMCKKLYNYLSELDDLLRSQTFSILTYPALDAKDLDSVELGTDRILTYDPGVSHKPEYIAPDAVAMDAYERRIEKTVEEIYRLANLKYKGGAMPSGVALKYLFEPTQQTLIAKAQNMQAAENKTANLVNLWEGNEPEDELVNIDYPQDYNLSDINADLDAAFSVKSLNISDRFNKEYDKNISRKILPNIDDKIQDEIDKEIEIGGNFIESDAEMQRIEDEPETE